MSTMPRDYQAEYTQRIAQFARRHGVDVPRSLARGHGRPGEEAKLRKAQRRLSREARMLAETPPE